VKIAPVTERWNEGERDWSFVKDPTAEIAAWERREGLSLPEDYRRFMLRYNGGRVYPRLFRTEAALVGMLGPHEPTSDVTYVDPIFSWATVEAHWRGEIYGRGVPPRHLVFAGTPGAIQLLMALTPENRGRVYTWIHSTDIWGTDRNTRIWPHAESFSRFLDGLFDDDDRSDFEDWERPIYVRLARELER
jgi:hypothetical protein